MSQAIQVSKEKPPYNLSSDQSNSASRSMPEGEQHISARANPRMVFQKSIGGDAGSSRKKPYRETPRTSSGSALTNINTCNQAFEPVIDYQKAAKTQETFVRHCQECYPFGVEATFSVSIKQMIVAQDAKYKQDTVVVRACEMKIVQNLKWVLTEMGDINQK